jgi:ribulose kinase
MSQRYYIGIDVGTGSVRAALVNQSGSLMASSVHPTQTWRDAHDHRIFEQSTKDIWNAVASTIKACLQESGVKPDDVKGLGFDSTCSLCVTDFDGKPVVVTKGDLLGEYGERNVILWVDHRAEKEADLINSTGSIVLDYVGGTISVGFYRLLPRLRYLTNVIIYSWRWKYQRSFG